MENTVNYVTFNPFHVTVFFLSPLKVSKNMWFSNVFWGVKKDASSMELVLKRLNFVFLTLLTPHLTIQNNIYMNKKFPIWQIYFLINYLIHYHSSWEKTLILQGQDYSALLHQLHLRRQKLVEIMPG